MPKLNIGSGRDFHQPGFINLDQRPEHSDISADARHLPIKNGSLDAVVSFHLVEHVPMADVVPMLREWARVMKSGATIAIECPEFDESCRQYLAAPPGPQKDRCLKIIFGFQPVDFHYNGFNADRLAWVMREAGFTDIKKAKPIRRIFGPTEALLRLEARKP